MQETDLTFFANENPNPVLQISLDGKLLYSNPASQPLINAWDIKLKQHLPDEAIAVAIDALKTGENHDFEVQVEQSIFLLTFVPFADRDYINIYGYDISPRKQYMHQLKHIENFDPLTELPNQKRFTRKLVDAVTFSQRHKNLGALLVIDIDDFTAVKQTLGADIADLLLCEVAERLSECVPIEYPIAHISNDNFAVIRPNLDEDADAANLAQVILDNLSQPFVIQNNDIEVNYSIGITVFPNDSDDVTRLISNASLAQTKAQEQKGNSYHFFQSYMHSAANARRSLLKDLRYALARQQLLVYYQPQIAVDTQKIVGAEALVRWQHPEHGLMTPGRFTRLAEEHGLINSIGEWVLFTACEQAKTWHQAGFDYLTMAVNVSPSQFRHADLLKIVRNILAETGVRPEQLELEVTENILIENLKAAKKLLTELHKLGVKLAIDDFGTGYSSLNYLQQLPVNKLKIDKCFVETITDNQQQVTIIENIIDIGHKMKMQIIAEGVEKLAELKFLRTHHCDEVQGFYFSEPLTAEEFTQLLRNQ